MSAGGSGFLAVDKSSKGGNFDLGITTPINFGNYFGGAATTGSSNPPIVAATISSPLIMISAIALLSLAIYKKGKK